MCDKEIIKYLEDIINNNPSPQDAGHVPGKLSDNIPFPVPVPVTDRVKIHIEYMNNIQTLTPKTRESTLIIALKKELSDLEKIINYINSAYQIIIDLNKKITDPEIQYMILPILVTGENEENKDNKANKSIQYINMLESQLGGSQTGGGGLATFFFACFNCNHVNSRIRNPRVKAGVQPLPLPRPAARAPQQQRRYNNIGLPPPWYQRQAVKPVEQPVGEHQRLPNQDIHTTFVDATNIVEEIKRAERSLDYLGQNIARIIYGDQTQEASNDPEVLNYVKNFCVKRYNELYFEKIPKLGGTATNNATGIELNVINKVKAEAYFTFLVSSFIEISNELNRKEIKNTKLVISFVIKINKESHFLEVRYTKDTTTDTSKFQTLFNNTIINYDTLDEVKINLYNNNFVHENIPKTLNIMVFHRNDFVNPTILQKNYKEFLNFINITTELTASEPAPSAPEYMRYKNVFLRANREIAKERRQRAKDVTYIEITNTDIQDIHDIIKNLTIYSD